MIDPETKELVLLLAAAAMDAGHKREAQRIEELQDQSTEKIVRVLSEIERVPRLNADLWKAIVMFKAHLGGHKPRCEVVDQCLRIQGLR